MFFRRGAPATPDEIYYQHCHNALVLASWELAGGSADADVSIAAAVWFAEKRAALRAAPVV